VVFELWAGMFKRAREAAAWDKEGVLEGRERGFGAFVS